MSRSNIIYLVVGALVVVVAIMGYQLYQDRQKPDLAIKIGPNGVSVDKK
jgi:predicted negative regulator of RcsB-dependent stress response